MPYLNTHISFVNNLIDLNLDKKYLQSGAIFPDIGMHVKLSKIKDFTDFFHHKEPEAKKGFIFSKELIKNAKTKEELSFAIGFYSHFYLDKNVHTLFHKLKLSDDEHLMLEFYRSYKDKDFKINKIYFPKHFFIETFKKTFKKEKDLKKYVKQIESINQFKLFKYKTLINLNIKFLVENNYGTKQKNNFLIKTIFFFKRKNYLKRYNLDIFNYLKPNKELKKKYLDLLNKVISKSRIEFKNIIKNNRILYK